MKWALILAALAVGACRAGADPTPYCAEKPVVVGDIIPAPSPPEVDSEGISATMADVANEHFNIQRDLRNSTEVLWHASLHLEDVAGSETTVPVIPDTLRSGDDGADRPVAVKAKMARRTTVMEQGMIQVQLHDSQEMAEKLTKMTPQQWRKRLRRFRREDRRKQRR